MEQINTVLEQLYQPVIQIVAVMRDVDLSEKNQRDHCDDNLVNNKHNLIKLMENKDKLKKLTLIGVVVLLVISFLGFIQIQIMILKAGLIFK